MLTVMQYVLSTDIATPKSLTATHPTCISWHHTLCDRPSQSTYIYIYIYICKCCICLLLDSFSVTSSLQFLHAIWMYVARPALLHLLTTSACHKLLSHKHPPSPHSLNSSVMSGQSLHMYIYTLYPCWPSIRTTFIHACRNVQCICILLPYCIYTGIPVSVN